MADLLFAERDVLSFSAAGPVAPNAAWSNMLNSWMRRRMKKWQMFAVTGSDLFRQSRIAPWTLKGTPALLEMVRT